MSVKKIYFVRHGETVANVADIVQGHLDELTPNGHAQAEVLAQRLKQLDFKNLLVSDYVRTKQTIIPLLSVITVEPVYTPLVRELRRPSQFVGEPRHADAFHHYEHEARQHISDASWHFSDEENYYDVVDRVQKFFAYIDTLEGDTVVVSHGRFIIMTMMFVIMGGKLTPEIWDANLSTFTSTNTGITVMTYKENKKVWALTTYNDHAHFAE